MSVTQQIDDQQPASPTGPASGTGIGEQPVPTLGTVMRIVAASPAESRAGRALKERWRINMAIIMGKRRGRIR